MTGLDYVVSLLTSSSGMGLVDLRREFDGELQSIELYALRETDLRELLQEGSSPESRNLIDIINKTVPEDLADILQVTLGRDGRESVPHSLKPIGLATCIPQIASAYRREGAVEALKSVLRLATELDVRCVEMVCGRIAERCPGAVADGKRCRAVVMENPETKLNTLMKSLAELRDFAKTLSKPVAVALEVEPGPLYVLKDLKTAAEILERTSGSDWMISCGEYQWHFVGLNIDIGHMLICQERRVDAWSTVDPMRVYNFHISDNAEMHFADLVPGAIHSIAPDDPQGFAGWLSCFLCVCERGNPSMFTRNVSVELEGCASPQWAHQALRNTNFVLNELKRQYNLRYEQCRDCHLHPSRGDAVFPGKAEQQEGRLVNQEPQGGGY